MAFFQFAGMEPTISRRFGWPGLSGYPTFAPISPVGTGSTPGAPPATGGSVVPPPVMGSPFANAMAAGRGGPSDAAMGRPSLPRPFDAMPAAAGINVGPGAGLNAGTPFRSALMAGGATAAPGLDPFGNEYIRGDDGSLRIRAPVSRWASANPFDFAGFAAPSGLGTLSTAISAIGRHGAERSFGTLGNVTAAMAAGFPQTTAGMRAFQAGAAAPTKSRPTPQRRDSGGNRGGGNARSAEARANVRDQLGRSFAGSSGRTLAR